MYVCMYACMHVYVYAYVHVDVDVDVRVCVCIYIYICIHIYIYIYMCVCVCVSIYIYVCFSENCGSSIDNPIAQWVPLCCLLFILLSTETRILGISSLSMHGEQKIPLTLSNPWNLHAHQIWV